MQNDDRIRHPGEEHHYNQGPQAGSFSPQNFGMGSTGQYPPSGGYITQNSEAIVDQAPPSGGYVPQIFTDPSGKLMEQPPKRPNPWKAATLVLSVLVVVLLATSTILVITRPGDSSKAVVVPTATTALGGQQPTSTGAITTPTGTANLSPTPGDTATPSSPAATPSATVAAGTLTENITLTCTGCNDPIRVKIGTIQIDTVNGRMIWNITLTDITSSSLGYSMNQFYLQANASQTQIPATFSQGQGSLVSNTPLDIQAVFAFVPYHTVTYALTAQVYAGNIGVTTTFDPVKIPF